MSRANQSNRSDPPTYEEERASRRLRARTSGQGSTHADDANVDASSGDTAQTRETEADDDALPNSPVNGNIPVDQPDEGTSKRRTFVTFEATDHIPQTDMLLHDVESDKRQISRLDSFESDIEMASIRLDKPERRFRRKGNLRESLERDLSGQVGRAQCAKLRSKSSRAAQPAAQRDLHRFLRCFGLFRCHKDAAKTNTKIDERVSKHGRYMISSTNLDRDTSFDYESTHHSERQYRLQAIQPKSKAKIPLWLRWLGLGSASIYDQSDNNSSTTSCKLCGVQANEVVVRFLHWMFRKSLVVVTLTVVASWFALALGFALVIWLAGTSHPECIGGSKDFAYFSDAFILSWTTFSTVGYGCVFVGAGVPNNGSDDVLKCATINGIVSLESFFGVLFGSMISAIMFVKVARVQSVAQVEFCEPVCIRYGPGVMMVEADTTLKESENESESLDEMDDIPCPILEFRIANRMFSVPGGEIMDASVKVVAVVSATDNILTRTGAEKDSMLRRLDSRRSWSRDMRSSSIDNKTNAHDNEDESEEIENEVQDVAYEEDASGDFMARTAFSNVECQTHEHPFFKRVFLIRHKLDHTSPLVKSPIREMIKANNGNWPGEFDTARDVKKTIQFDQLLVSLQGTSNADAKTVYARKVFDFADLIVGYSFVTMVCKDQSGALEIDLDLINDVVEQAGGGGEDLTADNEGRRTVHSFL